MKTKTNIKAGAGVTMKTIDKNRINAMRSCKEREN